MQSVKKLIAAAVAGMLVQPAAGLADPKKPDLAMDRASWSSIANYFECRAQLPMEELGEFEIKHMAGDRLKAEYRPVREARKDTEVKWVNAPWHEDRSGDTFKMKAIDGAFVLDTPNTFLLMTALDAGHWTSIRFNDKELLIPSIRWAEAANSLHACRKELSPLSIAQARDQSLFYKSGQRMVSEHHLKHLKDTARYIELDPEVSRVLVDSYTDLSGPRLRNLQISKERMADVVSALKEFGVPAEMVEGRAHGERYTVQESNTKRARDLARKVTIRIIRGEPDKQEETGQAPEVDADKAEETKENSDGSQPELNLESTESK